MNEGTGSWEALLLCALPLRVVFVSHTMVQAMVMGSPRPKSQAVCTGSTDLSCSVRTRVRFLRPSVHSMMAGASFQPSM